MNTPDVTREDGVGIATIAGILGVAQMSNSEAVQLASIIAAALVAMAIVAAGAYRRGKRAEFLPLPDEE